MADKQKSSTTAPPQSQCFLLEVIIGIFQAFSLVVVLLFTQFHRRDKNASTIIYFLVACIFLLYPTSIQAHGNGAPSSRCESMIPGHWVNAQETLCPYQVLVDKVVIAPGDRVNITLATLPGQQGFKGFFVMVKEAGEEDDHGNEKPVAKNKSFGTFQLRPTDNAQPVNCFEQESSAVTHVANDVKDSVELSWIAPKLLPQDGVRSKRTKHGRQYMEKELKILVTFVRDFWTYWPEVEPAGDVRLFLTDVSSPPTTTTPPPPKRSKPPRVSTTLPPQNQFRGNLPPLEPGSFSTAPPILDETGSGSWNHFSRAWSSFVDLLSSQLGSSSSSSSSSAAARR